ncbi:MAG: phage tail tape measure protein, partial [Oscillospiraceae bacterium]|nr:phage tail tape measure protein [Oscillospiraceae bacterium]
MKKCVQRMKELSSESSLAAAQTKLFGSAQEQLKQKIQGLEKQIKAQNDVVELNKSHAKDLTDHLQKWQKKQASLQTEIEATKKAIEESAKATGENSEETQKLKTRLTELQKEEKKAGEQVEACETKISKHKVATNKSEQALAELQVELKKTNQALKDAAWEKWEKGAQKAADNMTKVGKAMMPVTTAIVGMGTAAIKTTADFDSGMSAVQAISGATGDDLEALRDKALEMGGKTAFSASEAASAMEYMAMAGWTTEDMLAGIEGVMAAAAASGEDLALTSDIVTDGLTAFGLSAKDSAHFADVLVKAGNSANTSVSMMGETFKYAGAVCGTLGITIEDAAIATGLMGNAGIKASEAGTALRSGLTNLVKPTKQMATAMEKYGVSIQTTDDGSVDFMATMKNVRETLGGLDETTQAAAISTIFGKEAMSGWAAIVNATDKDFQNLTTAIYGAKGAAQKAADVRLDNLTGQFTILKGTIEGIAIQVGDILMPTIKKVVEKIQEWATAFSELDEDQKKQIVTIAGIVAAIGPALIVVGKVVGAIAKVRKVIDGLKKTFGVAKAGIKLFAVALSNPVVAIAVVVAAIIGLIAYIKHLWDTNEDFRKAVTKIWDNIKKTAKDVWNAIEETIGGAIEKAQETVSNTVKKIEKAAKDAWNNMKTTASTIWENIKSTINTKIENARSTVASVTEKIKTTMSNAWNSAKSTATSLWENIRTAITTKIDSAKATVSSVTETIKTTMSNAWNSAKSTATSLWENIRSAIETKIENARATVSSVTDAIKTTMSNAW